METIREVRIPTVIAVLKTEGTVCSMKNEDQNLPTRYQRGLTLAFLPLTAPRKQSTPSPDKDEENAVETSQSAKSGYPLENDKQSTINIIHVNDKELFLGRSVCTQYYQ